MKQKSIALKWIDPKTLDDNPANWRRHPAAQMEALTDVLSDPSLNCMHRGNMRATSAVDRLTASFEYVGPRESRRLGVIQASRHRRRGVQARNGKTPVTTKALAR